MRLIEKVSVYCPIYPTEDEEKILKALYRYFPSTKFYLKSYKDLVRDIDFKVAEGISKNIISLDYVRREIGKRKSKEILKKLLSSGEREFGYVLFLNKQALLKGKIYLMSGDVIPALGLIKIVIETNNKHLVKTWLLL